MQFELWSLWHFLYLLSPFILFGSIYFLVRNQPDRVKYIVGIVLGCISILILVVRNIDIFVENGWDKELIPLQVCHIGNIVTGCALISRKKWLIATSVCFNMVPALLAMLFADSLANYDTILKIRAQAYVWGHIFIVVCALYGLLIYRPKLAKQDLQSSLLFVGIMGILAIICNSAFRALFQWEPNYFYLFDYSGTPLKFLYNLFPTSIYGWFTINWFYTVSLICVFVGVLIGLFYASRFAVAKLSGESALPSGKHHSR